MAHVDSDLIKIRDNRDNILHRIDGQTLCGAHLANAYLRGAELAGADFRNANLRDVDFREANLLGADFRGADLSGARFEEANLERANFSGMALPRELNLRCAILFYADFSKTELLRTNFTEAHLGRATFSGAKLLACQFESATFCETNLAGAALSGCKMELSRLCNTDFTRAKDIAEMNFGSAGATVDCTTRWPAFSILNWSSSGLTGTFNLGYFALLSLALAFISRPLYALMAVMILTLLWIAFRYWYIREYKDFQAGFDREYLDHSWEGKKLSRQIADPREAQIGK